MMSWVSNSKEEPRDISINRENSRLDFRLDPSAILDGIETAARLICEIKPKRSSLGKELVVFVDFNGKIYSIGPNVIFSKIAHDIKWFEVCEDKM